MTSPYGSLTGIFQVTQGDPVHAIEGRQAVRQPRSVDRLFSGVPSVPMTGLRRKTAILIQFLITCPLVLAPLGA